MPSYFVGFRINGALKKAVEAAAEEAGCSPSMLAKEILRRHFLGDSAVSKYLERVPLPLSLQAEQLAHLRNIARAIEPTLADKARQDAISILNKIT